MPPSTSAFALAAGLGTAAWWLYQRRLSHSHRVASCATSCVTSFATACARAPSLAEFLSFRTYVFDCDGVIWGIEPSETVRSVSTINHLLRLGKRVMFVTNNSNKSRLAFVQQLESKGVVFGDAVSEADKLNMMVSASFTTARYLKENGLKRPFVITSSTGILDELRLAGITNYYATVLDDGAPHPDFHGASSGRDELVALALARPGVDCVVVGWDLSLTARKAALAINMIQWHCDLHAGDGGGGSGGYVPIPLLACAGDTGGVVGTTTAGAVGMGGGVGTDGVGGGKCGKCGEGGEGGDGGNGGRAAPREGSTRLPVRVIGNGAMADVIARSFDPPLPWKNLGKPSDNLIDLLRSPAGYGVDSASALMVGDTLQTDIAFGNRAGMKTLLVLSGVTTEKAMKEALVGGDTLRHPTFVLPSLGAFDKSGELG